MAGSFSLHRGATNDAWSVSLLAGVLSNAICGKLMDCYVGGCGGIMGNDSE